MTEGDCTTYDTEVGSLGSLRRAAEEAEETENERPSQLLACVMRTSSRSTGSIDGDFRRTASVTKLILASSRRSMHVVGQSVLRCTGLLAALPATTSRAAPARAQSCQPAANAPIRPVREPQRARRRVALRQWRRLADARAAVHLYRPIGDRARDARRDDFDHRNRLPRAPLYVLSSFLNVHFLELQQLLGMLVKKRFAFFRLVSSRALLNPTSKELQVCVC